jgi:UDP-N-acetylmuramoyl-tripeptide--D-alanyl-D-alanine ligase
MKEFCKNAVKKILKILARAILKKYRPEIVGVTGSVGKTSTRDAIFTVLSYKFSVRRNVKNYNNEIGLPLTIIGAGSGGRSVWSWVGVFAKALVLLIWKDRRYPEILVLEMAVDRIGDMKYLTDLAPCRLGVVTNVGPVHLEFFKTLERIAKEKAIMVSHLDKNGWAILNNDNIYTSAMQEESKARVLTYGCESEADFKASEINISQNSQDEVSGLNFKLTYQGSTVPVFLPNILGEHLIYAALAAVAVGTIYEMNLLEISQALRMFKAPTGRMSLLSGIKNTFIIDDTYNAGPDSMVAALKVLGKINAEGKKFAVLGDMLELGDYTEEAHRKVGVVLAQNKIDILITVGERARTIAAEVERQGMDSDNVFTFSDTDRAGRFLQERIESGDFILVKGSQGMRLEKIVKEIMAEPLKAKELLVRQDKPWA